MKSLVKPVSDISGYKVVKENAILELAKFEIVNATAHYMAALSMGTHAYTS